MACGVEETSPEHDDCCQREAAPQTPPGSTHTERAQIEAEDPRVLDIAHADSAEQVHHAENCACTGPDEQATDEWVRIRRGEGVESQQRDTNESATGEKSIGQTMGARIDPGQREGMRDEGCPRGDDETGHPGTVGSGDAGELDPIYVCG